MKNVLLVILLTLTAYAQAEAPKESGLYIGLGGGKAVIDMVDDSYVWFPDDNDVSWTAKIGYKFNPYISLEARYNDFGTFVVETPYIWPVAVDAVAATAHLVGTLPIKDSGFSLYGQVGYGRINLDDSYEDESYDTATAGLGVAFNPVPPLSILLAYDAYVFDADADSDIVIGNTSLSFTYTF